MEIETKQSKTVFFSIDKDQVFEFASQEVLCQLEVSFQKFQTHSHKLILTKTHILLAQISLYDDHSQTNQQYFAAKLSFDLKFQIEFAQHDQPRSQKIGITMFYNQQATNTFYTFHQPSLQIMRVMLSRLINQKGFHAQFKPVKKLGKGNFASVYQVIRAEDGKKFAVKAFSKANTYSSENGKQSLVNQLSIMRQLSHQSKNLLSLQAVYESDNSIYIVLELLEGKNLFQIMKQKNGVFSINQIRTIMKGLIRGIKVMTQKKIMHRDLKPQNIMFRPQNLTTPDTYDPVIVDFGLAARSDMLPYLFFRCGTPGFVAPQIIKIQQNQYYSPACDMFSIGCIFHILMTNSPLFTGTKYQQVYKKNKLMQTTIKKSTINKISPYALNILQRMLMVNPNQRITAAEALNNAMFNQNNLGNLGNLSKSNSSASINMSNNNKMGEIMFKMDSDQVQTDYPMSPVSGAVVGYQI